jgi:hypothetical protein
MAWRVFTHSLGGVAQGGLLFPRLSKPQRDRRVQKWARTMLKRVGVELRTLCAREFCALVTFGAPQRAGGRDRRAWAQDLHLEIGAMRSRVALRSP